MPSAAALPPQPEIVFHPAAQLLGWVIFLLAISAMQPVSLLGSAAALLLLALALAAAKLRQLLRRTRWIIVMMWLIYAYSTPGNPVFETAHTWSPTVEGLYDGLLQFSRLFCALASLSVVLSGLTAPQLISALYSLCWPLQGFGTLRERLAVRLALTLHYAETVVFERNTPWRETLEALLQPVEAEPGVIELPCYALRWRDAGLLGFCGLIWLGVRL